MAVRGGDGEGGGGHMKGERGPDAAVSAVTLVAIEPQYGSTLPF